MKFIPIGLVFAAHGVSGEVKFRYYNDGDGLLEYPSLFVDPSGTSIELKPTRIRRQGNLFIIRFMGFDTMAKSALLVKKELFIEEKDLPALEDDEYYDYQLVGLKVVTDGNALVGRVTSVMHVRANDILVIEGSKELLVALTEDHIVRISPAEGVVEVREEALVE